MTEPIKLPPIPTEWQRVWTNELCEWTKDYARLAVEQNTAELRAEVERLREVAELALEALDSDHPYVQLRAALALRAALKETK